MDFNKLTVKSQEAVAAAQEIARRRGNPEIVPDSPARRAARPGALRAPGRASRRHRAEARCAPGRAGRPAAAERVGGVLAPARQCRRRAPQASATTTSRASTCSWRSSPCRATRSSPGSSPCAAVAMSRRRIPRSTYQALQKFGRDLTEAARGRQARPGDRPRRGDSPRHPDPRRGARRTTPF